MSPCACGRTGPRMRCIGRTDDMLIVRGVNVFPSADPRGRERVRSGRQRPHLVKPEAQGVKQEPPLPVSVELAQDAAGRRRARGGDPRTAARGTRRPDAASSSCRGGAWSAASTSRSSSSARERRAAHDCRRELSPARLADRPGAARRSAAAARSGARAVAGRRSRSSRRRRTTRRASPSGHGARRRRRDHGRRDAAGELLQPVRDRARRGRPRRARASRSIARATRTPFRESSGPIRRTRPVEVRDVEFLRSITDRRIKITVPGPFTMTQQAQNDYYADERSLALAYAEAVNEELRDLKAAGADVVQIDEPYLQARPEPAREYAVEAINRALDGHRGRHGPPHLLRLRAHRSRPASRLPVPPRA